MLGTRQSGWPDFCLADMIRDQDVFLKARDVAFKIYKQDPELVQPDHYQIRYHLERKRFCVDGRLN